MRQHALPVRKLARGQCRCRRVERQRSLSPGLATGARALDPRAKALKADGVAGTDVVGAHYTSSSSRRALICA
jgi:hypothetical protein